MSIKMTANTASELAAFLRYVNDPLVNRAHAFNVRDDGLRFIAEGLTLPQLYEFVSDYRMQKPTARLIIENAAGLATLGFGLTLDQVADAVAQSILRPNAAV